MLRIEDTDRRRLVPGAEEEQIRALRWLGLEWDEGPDVGGPAGPYRQSERLSHYVEHAADLLRGGHAYYCFCTPERLAQVRQDQQKRKQPPRYDGRCRELSSADAQARVDAGESHVVRFRTPRQGATTAVDLLRGPIHVENTSLDDYILLKSDGLPVYHLAAPVDDRLMAITHVLRSSEWLPTFPLHVLIYQALGWEQPVWVHLSVFLNPSGKGKMSKRAVAESTSGAQSIYVLDLHDAGYLPEAVLNWIALMGWSLDDHAEFFPMADLLRVFSLERLTPSPAAVNFSKLDHFNGIHLRNLPAGDLARRLEPFFAQAGLPADSTALLPIVPLIQERIRTLEEAVEMAGFFFRSDVSPEPGALIAAGTTSADSVLAFQKSKDLIAGLPDLEPEAVEARLRNLATDLGWQARQLFGILRAATTGQIVSPPLTQTWKVIGREVLLHRIDHAVELLLPPSQ